MDASNVSPQGRIGFRPFSGIVGLAVVLAGCALWSPHKPASPAGPAPAATTAASPTAAPMPATTPPATSAPVAQASGSSGAPPPKVASPGGADPQRAAQAAKGLATPRTPTAAAAASTSAAAAPASAAARTAPAAPAAAPVAAAKTAPPPLDLASLEQRLKDTKAIGVFTKLSLKNQVDDLLEDFRNFHKGAGTTPPQSLRTQFDLLMIKVLALLQDGDPQLAASISSSRESLWDILKDPDKFAKI
jgi:hypothetical protein